ncbi:hypothetical protein [Actinoplanes sp. GCM10030250]|uniref:hypothetical protein n=1 Tax=Actinoplanes sp. GCM10030250 TaxID=3273376 RepID=UPI003617A67C
MRDHGGIGTEGGQHDVTPVQKAKTTALLGAFAATIGAAVLLVVSPAVFISLLPDWFTDDGAHRATASVVAGLGAGAAAFVAAWRGGSPRLRGALITVILLVAAGYGMHALKRQPAEDSSPPTPENTCVAYSGGHHTCPGG